MSQLPIEPLAADLETLFAAERAVPDVPGDLRARLEARIRTSLRGPRGGGGGGVKLAPLVGIAAVVGGAVAIHHGVRSSQMRESSSPERFLSVPGPRPQPAPAEVGTLPVGGWEIQEGVAPRPIEGLVTFDGRPMAGATVELTSVGTALLGAPLAVVRTAADGHFAFAPTITRPYVLVATAPDLAGATTGVDLRDPNVDAEHVEMSLGPCAVHLRGTITDEGGPVAEARVRRLTHNTFVGLTGPMVTADGAGAYEMCLPPGPSTIRIDADGYGAVEWRLRTYQDLREDVSLVPEGTVTGIAMDAVTLAPVAGAQINLRGYDRAAAKQPASHSALTGADGRFSISGLAPGRYGVGAWAADHMNWRDVQDLVVTAGASSPPVTLSLARTHEVSGVVTVGGAPLVGARLRSVLAGGYSFEAVTQPDGSFTVKGAMTGPNEIAVEGYRVVSERFDVANDDVHDLRVVAEPMAALHGTVVFAGKPASDARVTATPLAPGATPATNPPPVRTDRSGVFAIAGLAAGAYEIAAEDESLAAFSSPTRVTIGDERPPDREVVMKAGGSIRGEIIDQDGQPLAGARIAWDDDGAITKANERGVFVARALHGGTHQAHVALDGVALPSTATVTLADGEQRDDVRVVVTLGGATLAGRVVDDAGRGISDVLVGLAERGATVRTDSNGAFTVHASGPGPFTLHATRGDGATSAVANVQADDPVVLTLKNPGSISGHVRGFSSRVRVDARSADGLQLDGHIVDDTFVFATVPPGDYEVTAEDGDHAAIAHLTVAEGSTTETTLAARSTAPLVVHVGSANDGSSLAGITCWVDEAAGRSGALRGTSDETGTVSFAGAPVGGGTITCEGNPGLYSRVVAPVTVEDGGSSVSVLLPAAR